MSIVAISACEQFNQNSLTSIIKFHKDMSRSYLPGHLYKNKEIILIIDFRQMQARDIAGINELIDTPPAFDCIPLGAKTKRVFIISNAMKNKRANTIGNDFWRRVFTNSKLYILLNPQQ